MRVLHVITRLHLAGAERVAEILATGLVERGGAAAIAPVAGPRDPELAAQLRARLAAGGVTVLDGRRTSGVRRAALEAPLSLGRAVAAFDPDVVHLHTEIPEFAWALTTIVSRRAARLPLVRTVHNTVLWGGWRLAGRLAEARLGGARVAAVSCGARDAFVERQRRTMRRRASVEVIYNGVECTNAIEAAPWPARTPVLCFAGRLEAQKGIDVLLEALSLLDGSDIAFDVVIYGSGRLERDVAAAVTRLRRHVELLPPRLDLAGRLRSFDAIVMPSRFEGLGLVAIEALCAGVPVLATNAPGLNEALPDWYPGRCAVGDPAALAAMISGFVQDVEPWRAGAEVARQWARDRFAAGTMIDRYLELYRSACGVVAGTAGTLPPVPER